MRSSFKAPLMIRYAALLLLLLMSPVRIVAEDAIGRLPESSATKQEEAPVTLDGAPLFKLRGLSSLPAKGRAEAVSERIERIASDHSFPVADLKVIEEKEYATITAGNIVIVRITNADALYEGLRERQLLAAAHLSAIKSAIERYRLERTSNYLLGQSALALGASVLFMLALIIGGRLTARLQKSVNRGFQKQLDQLEEKSYQIVSSERLQRVWEGVINGFFALMALLAGILWLDFVLNLFPWTRAAAAWIVSSLLSPLQTMWTNVLDAFPGIVFILALALFTRYILKLTTLFFNGVASGRITITGFDSNWALPTYKLVRIALIALALVIAYPYIPGSESEAFKGISIFFGVLASIGGASIVANNLAGYALIYRKAFVQGDRVKIGDVTGEVISMGQQATHLRTPKNEEVTIPSAQIVSSPVINYSSLVKNKGLILHTTVGIGYAVPWRQVEAILLEAARRTDCLLKDPPPFVLIKSLDTFSTTYELNAHSDKPHEMEKQYHALHQNILDVFNEYGVQIMTPAYEGDPEKPLVVPKERWFIPPFNQ
ncbi:mechanosensitive ion channel MscS [Estrella lausannensis]|uniref:Mechanosensitive ion channel MscS n=2 Tax=Estrella lausannensis TaxID=483423 RepID=A0A0H5DRC7_9BACT|nr:mechanosensitive ion channel MscS [Estrella lausannensis]